jgi:hypothetical protein
MVPCAPGAMAGLVAVTVIAWSSVARTVMSGSG